MHLQLVQQVIVYAPKELDPTESTALTPIAGEAHSDPFQIATHRGVPGCKPYLFPIMGRKGQLDPLKKSLEASTVRITLLDKRVVPGGNQQVRWATAFMGDTLGVGRLPGCKVVVRESTTGPTGAFTTVFTGRIVDVETDGSGTLLLGFTVRDLPRELGKAKCFVGRPHAAVESYAFMGRHWPLGIWKPWGGMMYAAEVQGRLRTDGTYGRWIEIESRDQSNPYNFITDWLRKADVPFGWDYAGATPSRPLNRALLATSTTLRVRLTGGATGMLGIRGLLCKWKGTAIDGLSGWHISGIVVDQVPEGERDRIAIPADNTLVTVQIETPGVEPSEACPLYINNVHPVQLAKDILSGYYGFLNNDGSVIRSYAYDAAALDALIADTSIPKGKWKITKMWDAMKFLEEQICQPYHLGMRVDALGRIVFVDLRLPASTVGLPQINQADLAEGSIKWSHSAMGAVTRLRVDYQCDRQVQLEELSLDSGAVPADDSQLIKSFDRDYKDVTFGRLGMGDEFHTIKAHGFRVSSVETIGGQAAERKLIGDVSRAAEHLRHPFANGPEEFSGKFRRTAAVEQAQLGTWVLVNLDQRPNSETNERGGQRLALVIARDDLGLHRGLTFLDAGPNVMCTPPAVGAISQEAGNTRNGISVPITINAQADHVEVEYAVTDGSVSAIANVPKDRWTRWRNNVVGAAGAVVTLTINPLPSGRRVWIRARSINVKAGVKKLPSAWVDSSGALDYVDLAALTAPATPTASDVSAIGCTLNWVPGDETARTQIWARTPSGSGTWERIAMVDPGVRQYPVGGLTTGQAYDFRLQHYDGGDGQSSYSGTLTVTPNGAVPRCPPAGGLTWESGIR